MTQKETLVPRLRRTRTAIAGTAATPTVVPETPAVSRELKTQLKLISEAHAAIDEATRKLTEATGIVETLLLEHKMKGFTDGVLMASVVERWSNEKRIVDPKRFRAAVGDTDFFNAIVVPVGAAEKILSPKEVAQITNTIPKKRMGKVVKIGPVSKEK